MFHDVSRAGLSGVNKLGLMVSAANIGLDRYSLARWSQGTEVPGTGSRSVGTCRIGRPALAGQPVRSARRDTQCRNTANVCRWIGRSSRGFSSVGSSRSRNCSTRSRGSSTDRRVAPCRAISSPLLAGGHFYQHLGYFTLLAPAQQFAHTRTSAYVDSQVSRARAVAARSEGV